MLFLYERHVISLDARLIWKGCNITWCSFYMKGVYCFILHNTDARYTCKPSNCFEKKLITKTSSLTVTMFWLVLRISVETRSYMSSILENNIHIHDNNLWAVLLLLNIYIYLTLFFEDYGGHLEQKSILPISPLAKVG